MSDQSIESRCGLLCGKCEYAQSKGCEGCIAIQKPFWADSCPVKACCEGKALDHCGLCGSFPCDLLQAFSYDPEQGDRGQRIRQCRTWATY